LPNEPDAPPDNTIFSREALMTQAVCFKCGEIKWGAFNRCGQCQAIPRTDDDLMSSLAFTDHYFEPDELQQIGRDVESGRTPQLPYAWREKLAPAIQEAKRLGIGQDAKRKTRRIQRRSLVDALRSRRVRILFAVVAAACLVAASLWITNHLDQRRRSVLSDIRRFELATTFYGSHDYDGVIGILRPIADAGDANAQVNLANAAHWLGNRLVLRKDVAEQPEEYREEDERKYTCLAALQDDAEAQNKLGWIAFHSNEKEAVSWWQQAAKLGNPNALYTLALPTHFGMYGLPKDDKSALQMLLEAAEMGHDGAQFDLANIYWDGKGDSNPPWTTARQDFAEAAKWYLAAAERGNSFAQEKIGLMYYRGIALTQNFAEAYFWLNLAASDNVANQMASQNGDYGAHLNAIKTMRDDAGSRLTTERLNSIQEQLKNWRAIPSSNHNELEWRDRPALPGSAPRTTMDNLSSSSACSQLSGAAQEK
jgi:TPR repeat protein